MKRQDYTVENPSYSVFTPKCCNDHKQACSKRNHMETSEWKFEDDHAITQDKNFDPWNRDTPSTQRKLKCMEEIDEALEVETRQILLNEIEKVASQTHEIELDDKIEESKVPDSEPMSTRDEENSENLRNLRECKEETNPYLILLNRLDEEEGVRMPLIEDKLKLAEDRLRISTTKFCQACEELLEEKPDNSDSSEIFALLSPKKVQEAFRPKVLDPSLQPPQTLSVSEINKKPMVGTSVTPEQKKETRKKEMKMKAVLKQGFYLPSDTWFSREKDAPSLTPEEIDFLNSMSTKAFLKFLEERKKSPPKVLQEIQKKFEEIQESAKPK